MADYAAEADPRFSDKGSGPDDEPRARRGLSGGRKKGSPRIAFTGEEYGFGYQATRTFLERARRRGTVFDGGLRGLSARTEREYDEASKNSGFDYAKDIPQPLRAKELALMAVKQGTADFAVVPFYNPYAGYDYESLRALSSLKTVLGVEQVEATDSLCLAVHESQLYDLIQSSHPGTGFSALQRRFRSSWSGPVDSGSGNSPGAAFAPEMPRAGLPIDMADQKLIRDRIDVVFAGPEAARRCKSKLDGLRAIGVDVKETPQLIEPHRELAKLARSTSYMPRQTNTIFDARTGEVRSSTVIDAEAQAGKLFGMVLPYEVAMRSSDYVIIDHKFDDGLEEKTRFMVVENNPDHTLTEDAYRTTDARTRYWFRRMRVLAEQLEEPGFARRIAGFVTLAGLLLLGVGFAGVSGWDGLPLLSATEANVAAADWAAVLVGATVALSGAAMMVFGSVSTLGRGVRVMLRFRRDGTAASISDVENFLRNFGVSHAVVRLNEDSEQSKPADVLLDIEFKADDFAHEPFRRAWGPVARGALKKAFARWKDRGVLVLAAMPFDEAQLPKHAQRRWWNEAIWSWAQDAAETWAIRVQRILVYYAIPALAIIGVMRATMPETLASLINGAGAAFGALWTIAARMIGG